MNLTYNEKYNFAVNLIKKGYLIHCTSNDFNEFDKSFIKGGSRAKEGYGFYFSDMPYKSIEYGNNFKIIKKSHFNFLNSNELIENIFQNDFEEKFYYLENELDNTRNIQQYDKINQEIEIIKNKYNKIGGQKFFNYINLITKQYNIKTIGELEYNINNPQENIPKLINYYLYLGYDGYETDGIYTVFNIKKLNKECKTVKPTNNKLNLPESKINKIIKQTIQKFI